jgi:hypothetical protein
VAGGVRRITTQEALLQILAEKALNGDQRASEHLIGRKLRCKVEKGGAPVIAVDSNDRAILDEYYVDRKALEAERSASGSTHPTTSRQNAWN